MKENIIQQKSFAFGIKNANVNKYNESSSFASLLILFIFSLTILHYYF